LSYVYFVPVARVPVGDAAYVNIVIARVAVDTESYITKTVTELQCDPHAALSSLFVSAPSGTCLFLDAAPVAYAAVCSVRPDPIGHPGVHSARA
jgi:hypothetical protein